MVQPKYHSFLCEMKLFLWSLIWWDPRKDLDYSKRVYNHRISRAIRTVVCALGMLTKTFAVLLTSMEASVEVSEALVKSICVFHNLIKCENNFDYFPSDDVDEATKSYNSNTSDKPHTNKKYKAVTRSHGSPWYLERIFCFPSWSSWVTRSKDPVMLNGFFYIYIKRILAKGKQKYIKKKIYIYIYTACRQTL